MKPTSLAARILLGLALASLPFVHYRCGGGGHSHSHPPMKVDAR